jgi:hypothetical protein
MKSLFFSEDLFLAYVAASAKMIMFFLSIFCGCFS